MTGRTFSGPMACTPRTHVTDESMPPDRAITSLCRPAAPNTLRMKSLMRASICGQSMLSMCLLSFDFGDGEGLWWSMMYIDNYLAAKPRRGWFTAPTADNEFYQLDQGRAEHVRSPASCRDRGWMWGWA